MRQVRAAARAMVEMRNLCNLPVRDHAKIQPEKGAGQRIPEGEEVSVRLTKNLRKPGKGIKGAEHLQETGTESQVIGTDDP